MLQQHYTYANPIEPDERAFIRGLSRHAVSRRAPLPGEVCISITNPASLGRYSTAMPTFCAWGFMTPTGKGGNFTVMSPERANAVLAFGARYKHNPITVHGEAGASRSAAVGLFLAAWLNRPLQLTATDVPEPNAWVVNQLRAAALYRGLRRLDWRLMFCGLRGRKDFLAIKTTIFLPITAV